MKIYTHQFKGGGRDVIAWQFLKTSALPTWAADSFKSVRPNEDVLYHKSGERVQLTDWICTHGNGMAFVLTNKEFMDVMVKLPDAFTK